MKHSKECGNHPVEDQCLIQLNKPTHSTNRIYDEKGLARTLKGNCGDKTGKYKTENGVRRLTPIECERLQGFPDNWTKGVSDTQRYRQCGNAVTVPVVEEIMKILCPSI